MKRSVEKLIWVASGLVLLAGVMRWNYLVPDGSIGAPASNQAGLSVLESSLGTPPLSRIADARTLVEGNLFRLDRRPAAVQFGLTPTEPLPAPPPALPPRPRLWVSGILGGPPWEVLLEGVPGRAGAVLVRQGDTVSGLHIRRVGADTAVIVGADTTWTLTLRHKWQ